MSASSEKNPPDIADEDKDALLRVLAMFPNTQETFFLEIYGRLSEVGQVDVHILILEKYKEQLIENAKTRK